MGNWHSKVAAPWHCVRCASTYTGVQTIHSVATVTRGTMSELERATLPANTVNTPTICRQDGLGCKAVAPYPGRGVTRLLCRRDPNVAPKLGAAKGIAATIVRVIPNRRGQPIATANDVVAVLSQV